MRSGDALREWMYARKHGPVITLPEKLSLILALPFGLTCCGDGWIQTG